MHNCLIYNVQYLIIQTISNNMNAYFAMFFSVGFSVGVYLMVLTHAFLLHKNNSATKWAGMASLAFLLCYIKDFICYFCFNFISATPQRLQMMTILEVPLYSVCAYFVCRELVQPGWSRWHVWLLHVLAQVPFPLAYIFFPSPQTLILAYAVQVAYLIFAAIMVMSRRAFFIRSMKNEYTAGNIYEYIRRINTILISYLILVVAYVPTYFIQFRAEVVVWYLLCPLLWAAIVSLVTRHRIPKKVRALVKADEAHRRGRTAAALVPGRKYPFEKELKNLFVVEKIHHNSRLTLSDVADMLNVDRNDLTEYFREVPGTTFYRYVNSFRVKEAEHAIVRGGTPLEAIGADVGFESNSSFVAAFKQVHNCTPLYYKYQLDEKRKSRLPH